jgi:hypothetical protein
LACTTSQRLSLVLGHSIWWRCRAAKVLGSKNNVTHAGLCTGAPPNPVVHTRLVCTRKWRCVSFILRNRRRRCFGEWQRLRTAKPTHGSGDPSLLHFEGKNPSRKSMQWHTNRQYKRDGREETHQTSPWRSMELFSKRRYCQTHVNTHKFTCKRRGQKRAGRSFICPCVSQALVLQRMRGHSAGRCGCAGRIFCVSTAELLLPFGMTALLDDIGLTQADCASSDFCATQHNQGMLGQYISCTYNIPNSVSKATSPRKLNSTPIPIAEPQWYVSYTLVQVLRMKPT